MGMELPWPGDGIQLRGRGSLCSGICHQAETTDTSGHCSCQEKAREKGQAYLIQLAHGSTGGRDGVIDKEEQSIFWPQVDPLSD